LRKPLPQQGSGDVASRHPRFYAAGGAGRGFLCGSAYSALDQAAARQIQQLKTITKLSIFAFSTPLQIRLPALQRCRLNTSYTPFEAVRAMEQALLPTIEANRKANLKNERTFVL
jgi:hypothetical protein